MTGCTNCERVACQMDALRSEVRDQLLEQTKALIEQTKAVTETAVTMRLMKEQLLGDGQPGAGKCAMHESEIRMLSNWKTASDAQMRLIKILVGVVSVPGLAQAYTVVRHFFVK